MIVVGKEYKPRAVSLTDESYARLRAIAERRETSVSTIIREAIRKALADEPEMQQPDRAAA